MSHQIMRERGREGGREPTFETKYKNLYAPYQT